MYCRPKQRMTQRFLSRSEKGPCTTHWPSPMRRARRVLLPQSPAHYSQSGFSKWLYDHLFRSIPLSKETNGLFCRRECGENVYYRELLTRLTVRQVEKAEEQLSSLFSEVNPRAGTVAEWSRNCQRHGHLIGHVFVIGRQGIDLIFAVL